MKKSTRVEFLNFFFSEVNGPLDTLESFDLAEKQSVSTPHNFILHDKVKGTDENEWMFRLPWPLLDMATVKIPVSFQCFQLWS